MQKLVDFLEKQPQGYKARLARAIQRVPSYFSRQLAGDRAFTEADCIGIEKFTAGEVRCEDILPAIDWAFIRRSPVPHAVTVPNVSALAAFFAQLSPVDRAAFGKEIDAASVAGARGNEWIAAMHAVAVRMGATFSLDELLAEHQAGLWHAAAERAALTFLPADLRLLPGPREVHDRQFVKSRSRDFEPHPAGPDPFDSKAAA